MPFAVVFSGAFYHYRISNLIERYQSGPNSFLFRNRSTARIRGMELEARATLPRSFALSVTAQSSRGRDDQDGTPIDDIAPASIGVVLRHRARAVGSYVRVTAFAAHEAAVDAAVGYLERDLGPEAEAVRALLDNRDPDRIPELVERLPEDVRADLEALSLARRDLARMQARVMLIHGRDDAIVPWTESAGLAAALPESRVSVALLDSFAHADASPGGLLDGVRLWRAIYRVMGERYGPPSNHDASLQRP